MKYVGVDGCPDGWLAVEYAGKEFKSAKQYDGIEDLWTDHNDAKLILIDVPVGLREEDNTPRPCDNAARECLGSPRSSSVFPTPVRSVLGADSYQEARKRQEEKTDGSLGAQTWGISNKIEELDVFLRSDENNAINTVREAHPEVCYWALNDEESTQYSKTGAPVTAFWERVEILKTVEPRILSDIRQAGTDLMCEATNDDLLDAFVLAVTGTTLTGEVRSIPKEWPENDDGDPEGLPMEMVYARREAGQN